MGYGDGGVREGFKVDDLFGLINTATKQVAAKLKEMQGTDDVSIPNMFEMQMLMNHLSQLSEMSTGVVSASNTAISSMARNVKA
jgi:hypothetical protein